MLRPNRLILGQLFGSPGATYTGVFPGHLCGVEIERVYTGVFVYL